jgi:hypothetical protein
LLSPINWKSIIQSTRTPPINVVVVVIAFIASNQSTNQLEINQSTGTPSNQSINQSINWNAFQSINQSTRTPPINHPIYPQIVILYFYTRILWICDPRYNMFFYWK